MKIRRAKTSETDALSELSMLSKQSNGYDDAFMKACREELRVTPESLAASEYWVVGGGELCGCACLHVAPDGRSGEVGRFFVHPRYQRQGVGKLLWAKLLERALAQKLEFLHLDADPFAVPFYEARGFTTRKLVPSGSIAGRTIPYMELQLPKPAL